MPEYLTDERVRVHVLLRLRCRGTHQLNCQNMYQSNMSEYQADQNVRLDFRGRCQNQCQKMSDADVRIHVRLHVQQNAR